MHTLPSININEKWEESFKVLELSPLSTQRVILKSFFKVMVGGLEVIFVHFKLSAMIMVAGVVKRTDQKAAMSDLKWQTYAMIWSWYHT